MAYEDSLLRRPFFPSAEKLKEWGGALVNAFTPAATSIPAAGPFTPTAVIPQTTVDGTKIPLPFSQLRYTGPLIGTGPFGALKGTPAPPPQPEPVKTDIGAYAATRFPFSFDVAKTQTPSMQQPNIAALTGGAAPPTFTAPTQIPFTPSKPTVEKYDTAVKFGTISGTPEQIERLNAGFQMGKDGKRLVRTYNSPDRTPAQQQALLAQMREQGGKIKKNLAEAETKRQGQLTKDYYAFLQSQAEKTMQEALTPKFGGVGQESKRRAEQAMVEASRFAEGAKTGKAPFATENITTPYGEVFRSRSGRYFPVANTSGFSGFAPQFQLPSMPAPSGFLSSGYMPSFSNLGPQTRVYL